MYWLMDEDALDLPKDKVDTREKRELEAKASRDTVADRAVGGINLVNLRAEFLHFLFVDENGKAGESGAVTNDTSASLDKRHSMIAVSDLRTIIADHDLDPARFDELLMVAVAHEMTHMLFERTTGTFDENEHTIALNLNCIMYGPLTQERLELSTVKFFADVQAELKVKKNQALVLDPYQ